MKPIKEEIEALLQTAMPIALRDMDNVALQNRIDKKYIIHINRLPSILQQVLENYFVLDINGCRIFTYKTVYFDTIDFRFFKDHHNGFANRIKVRYREYVESSNAFFEIKRKYRGYRTDKFRKPINVEDMQQNLGDDEYLQIRDRYRKHEIDNLDITLHNSFYRLTLVSKKFTERATIDFHIGFSKLDQKVELDDIAIIEVKQGKYDDSSKIVQVLKKERIYPNSISKYIYGLLLLAKGVKYNAFKSILNKINKIQATHGIARQPL